MRRAPNSTLHPTHLPAPLPPAPLTLRGGMLTAKWAGECGVMRREEKTRVTIEMEKGWLITATG
jgi:hypothetical protein